MRLLLTKILLLVAYSFVLAHTLVPHHHDDEKEAIESHHDDGKDHNIFSFGQIDHSFLPSQKAVVKQSDLASISPFVFYFSNLFVSLNSSNITFQVLEEFPPPKNYFHPYSFRGPPVP